MRENGAAAADGADAADIVAMHPARIGRVARAVEQLDEAPAALALLELQARPRCEWADRELGELGSRTLAHVEVGQSLEELQVVVPAAHDHGPEVLHGEGRAGVALAPGRISPTPRR